MFLEILQNSQENTFARVSFLIKLQASLFYRTLLGDWFWKVTFLKRWSSDILTYQAKIIFFLIFFYTKWEVFFQIKFHLGMKLTCKQKFFHPGTNFIPGWDFMSVTCKRTLIFAFVIPCYIYLFIYFQFI